MIPSYLHGLDAVVGRWGRVGAFCGCQINSMNDEQQPAAQRPQDHYFAMGGVHEVFVNQSQPKSTNVNLSRPRGNLTAT